LLVFVRTVERNIDGTALLRAAVMVGEDCCERRVRI
ncbi:MAG: hypothetical protein RL745_382, partial [Actinomycetota bacterium]